jgi:hypothetical protein
MDMKKYYTISSAEIARTNKLCVKDLYFYKDLFQQILIGRKADLKFYELQEVNDSDFVFEPGLRTGIEKQIVFFTQRLDLINKRLDEQGLTTLRTTAN